MKRRAYGRDFGLSSRMFLTMFLLGAVYVAFFVVLLQLFDLGLFAVILIIGGLAFLQYFTSDKIALAAAGAKVIERDQAPDLHDMVERLCAMADLPKPRIAVIRPTYRTRSRPGEARRSRWSPLRAASGSGWSRARSRVSSRTSSPTSRTATSPS
jgi:heat shock protein HtpX